MSPKRTSGGPCEYHSQARTASDARITDFPLLPAVTRLSPLGRDGIESYFTAAGPDSGVVPEPITFWATRPLLTALAGRCSLRWRQSSTMQIPPNSWQRVTNVVSLRGAALRPATFSNNDGASHRY